jgi:DNA-binding NarL/FixJ family response regulator
LRFLIVDDNPGFLRAAQSLLELQGVAVVGLASTCAEALQQTERLRPDVTLVDIELGDQSGFDVARRLREMAKQTRPRVIMISTHSEQDYADLVAATPVVGFLSKTELSADAIHGLLGRHGDAMGETGPGGEPRGG